MNVHLSPQTILVVVAKNTNTSNTSGTKDKFENVIASQFLCIESPALDMLPTVCIFPVNRVNKLLLFIVNVGQEEVTITKCCTLTYLTPAQYDNHSETMKNNQGSLIANILVATSEIQGETLPSILTSSKMISPGDHTPLSKLVLQDTKISADTQKFYGLIHAFEDIISSSSMILAVQN